MTDIPLTPDRELPQHAFGADGVLARVRFFDTKTPLGVKASTAILRGEWVLVRDGAGKVWVKAR